MNKELMNRCDLLAKNRDTMWESFYWSGGEMSLAGSSFYVGLNKEADREKLKECQQILKKKASVFSKYRGYAQMPLICKMAIAENPEKYFEDICGIVEGMKELKWIQADYKVLAALTIYDHTEPTAYTESIRKMADIFEGMKKNHPWITSDADIPFAAMLAVTDLDTEALLTEAENCYQTLLEHFRSKDAVQSLGFVLAVDKGPTDEKCQKIRQIWDMMDEKGHKYGSRYELAVLGTLCMLNLPVEKIVEEIIEADEYLKRKKGFSGIHMGDKTRRMYAALMVMDTHAPAAERSHESLVDSMLAVVIAMEICMIMVMTTVCVSTTHAY